ncbi:MULTISPECIES: HD domain-containing protein [unclassified Desulfovibrio]|uniref:3'-5' exoribonuclease YhaM family protein n=1 Tax=unclassified Desulfovibrio TaxID=2593640 RepID=UPI0013ECFAF3|nr:MULTISPECIES: HD domain-containing protein [unclassified Desulfovibrio]
MEKGDFVKDIVPNAEASGIFAVAEASLAQSRNGPYWRLVLADASGSIEAKIWSPLSGEFSEIAPGTLAEVEGRASLFRSAVQLAVEKFRPLDATEAPRVDQTAFLPASPYPLDAMFDELMALCREEFTHKPWRKLVFAVLEDAELAPLFRLSPAAKSVHHAYAGGLLEHTLGVFKACRRMAEQYPELDRQALLAGALFHDFGKIREFSGGFSNDYTTEGRLLGHLMLGVELLAPFLARSGLEPGLQEHLRHLILSHHGELEFGAVRQPHTPEALALHYADNLDAKLAQCRGLFAALDGEGPGWTPWQATLGRPMYRPPRTPAARPPAPKGRKNARREECLSLLKA